MAHIDKNYLYDQEGDYSGLICKEDVTREVQGVIANVPERLELARSIVRGPTPEVEMGAQRDSPVVCPFKSLCGSFLPDYPVQTLPRGGEIAKQLLIDGIRDIREIPDARLKNPLHERIRVCVQQEKVALDKKLVLFLNQLGYPRYYLDFETIQFPHTKMARYSSI